MRRFASTMPMGINARPRKNTIGMATEVRSPMYGLSKCPGANKTNNQENPASVTSVTPSMLIQWLAKRIRIGRRSSVIGLRIQIRDQVAHLCPVEARPFDVFRFHLIGHLRPVTPQDRNHHRRTELFSPEFRRSTGRVLVACTAVPRLEKS